MRIATTDTLSTDTLDATVDAARIAFAIARGGKTSQPVVLRANEYSDVHTAAAAAIIGGQHPDLGINYRSIKIIANHSVHGSELLVRADCEDERVELDEAVLPDDGFITVVVRVVSEHEISTLAQIEILGSIKARISQRLENENELYVAQWIFIIEDGR